MAGDFGPRRGSILLEPEVEARFRALEDSRNAQDERAEVLANAGVTTDGTGQGVAGIPGTDGGGTISALSGDVTGPPGSNRVVAVQRQPFTAGTVAGQVPVYSGSAWVPDVFDLAGDVTGDYNANTVAKLLGKALSAAGSAAGQVYVYDGSQWALTKPVLFDHFADVANTSGETDLYSDTLAAGQLANNGEKLALAYAGTFTGAVSSTQQLKAYFGGTAIFDSGALSIGVATDSWDLKVFVIRESSSVVRCTASLTTNFATLSSYATYTRITGLTLANTQVVKVTGTAAGVGAAAGQITASMGTIEWKARA